MLLIKRLEVKEYYYTNEDDQSVHRAHMEKEGWKHSGQFRENMMFFGRADLGYQLYGKFTRERSHPIPVEDVKRMDLFSSHNHESFVCDEEVILGSHRTYNVGDQLKLLPYLDAPGFPKDSDYTVNNVDNKRITVEDSFGLKHTFSSHVGAIDFIGYTFSEKPALAIELCNNPRVFAVGDVLTPIRILNDSYFSAGGKFVVVSEDGNTLSVLNTQDVAVTFSTVLTDPRYIGLFFEKVNNTGEFLANLKDLAVFSVLFSNNTVLNTIDKRYTEICRFLDEFLCSEYYKFDLGDLVLQSSVTQYHKIDGGLVFFDEEARHVSIYKVTGARLMLKPTSAVFRIFTNLGWYDMIITPKK